MSKKATRGRDAKRINEKDVEETRTSVDDGVAVDNTSIGLLLSDRQQELLQLKRDV